ncbi:MAG: sigma-54 interaction domain-containing protein [Candidatus Binatia bacterium]
MSEKEKISSRPLSREHLNLRLIVLIPVVFILVSLSAALLSMTLTQFVLRPPTPSSKDLLFLQLWIVGSSLLAGLLGAFLAYGITKPVRRAILEAQKMIGYVDADSPPIRAANEVRALSALFDQAFVSFIELVQAREMLDSVNEGIVALDKEGRVAGMNLRAQEILEVSLAEARHKSLSDLLDRSPTNGILLAITQNVLREHEERVHNRIPLCPPSGKETLLSVKVSPLKLKSEPRELLGAIAAFKEQLDRSADLPEIIGRSEPLTEVLDLVAKVAPTDSTVLLMGESGTGKELIADAIHRLSRRKGKPFMKLNCAAIPEGLLESELFGHEKGAFTGANSKKPGKFELASGGTIFLDEIGDMSPSTQAKLLRVLQQKEFTPVGGSQVKQVDVRIIAATNKELLQEVQQGRFREDLFYRLNVMTFSIPPLRERKSDIPFLADHFLEEAAKRSNNEKKSLSRSAMDRLLAYSWPGNVRELGNAIERAFILSNGSAIQPEDLPTTPKASPVNAHTRQHQVEENWLERQVSLNETLESVEKELIIQALKKSGGVQVEAAKLLGLNHKNLWHKIKKHNIIPDDLKNHG